MQIIQRIPSGSVPVAADGNKKSVVRRDALIAKLNKLCFHQRPVVFTFKRTEDDDTIHCRAIPLPCCDEWLTCEWVDDPLDGVDLSAYLLHAIYILDDIRFTVPAPQLDHIDRHGIRVLLPASANAIDLRQQVRYPCQGATACIEGRGSFCYGSLLDFHTTAFRMAIDSAPPAASTTLPVNDCWRTTLTVQGEALFRGMCRIVRTEPHAGGVAVVLSPVHENIPVQAPKRHRCERVRPLPAPYIRFRHPFTGRMVILDVIEISGSGFSVSETVRQAALLPGMRIPSLELNISQIFRVACSAQVVNRRVAAGADARQASVVCGIAFTDMSMDGHTRLVAHLHQTRDQRILISNSPDMHALWDFFFDTGFIYPHKYKHIHRQQTAVRETIEKIYLDRPRTSRHFIFQDKGVIKGLIALQRVYRRTWMMHHLAARKDAVIAGPKVLSLIGSYINDSYCLPSNRMKYAVVYYRQENKFPHLVFGGVARSVRDPQICSLDTFAYFHATPEVRTAGDDRDFCLKTASEEDLSALEAGYGRLSGGLMLAALDLLPGQSDDAELDAAYQADGLRRERHRYALCRDGMTVAILVVLVTDIGLNLSDLTHCIHVFALRPDRIRPTALAAALSNLAREHYTGATTVNLYPAEAADDLGIDAEKRYTLWTYEIKYADLYYDHLQKISRFLSVRE